MWQARASRIDRFHRYVGYGAQWMLLAMLMLMVASVLQRYALAWNPVWQQELIQWLHAAVFLLAAPFALAQNRHVRVDVFYARFSARQKAWIELLGALLLTVPVCAVLGWVATDFILSSWSIAEGSREPGGLPGVFMVKTLIWAWCGLMGLAALAQILHAIALLQRPSEV